ncbi:MAG: RhuM family protein [Velocimicrobium sp.]
MSNNKTLEYYNSHAHVQMEGERKLYQKITDIYASRSADYEIDSELTKEFFATAQNKLHYAITGETTAEIVKHRANTADVNMGLQIWKRAPEGRIRKQNVSVAKNYLYKDELELLNRIVTMYLDYAELQSIEHRVMYMSDWIERLNEFLKFNRKDILENKGMVTAEVAKIFAECEYEKYSKIADKSAVSDFDKFLEQEHETTTEWK